MSGSGPVENLTCNNIAKRAGLVCFHIGILLIVLCRSCDVRLDDGPMCNRAVGWMIA